MLRINSQQAEFMNDKEHLEWLEHEKARKAAEHERLKKMVDESEKDHLKNVTAEAAEAAAPETEVPEKWTEDTDDDEYYE